MRYFVTIHATDDVSFVELGSFDFDLVVGSSQRRARSVEGLLSLGEVGKLVDLGYEVTVQQPETARARARDIISYKAWRESVS